MKILLINNFSGRGSTGKIVNDLNREYNEQGHVSQICYGRFKGSENDGFCFCTEFEAHLQSFLCRHGLTLQFGGNYLSTRRLIHYIKQEAPDIVHIHCINGFCVNIYQLLSYLANHNIKTVITHHAEFFYTGACGYAVNCNKYEADTGCYNCGNLTYATNCSFVDRSNESWHRMKKTFSKFKKENLIFTAVSPWVKSRSQRSPITQDFYCKVVENGINTNVFTFRKYKELSCIPNSNRVEVLHVTALFSDTDIIKGGKYLIALAKMNPDIVFTVIATKTDISGTLPQNIVLLGSVASQSELAHYYSRANLTLITSKMETFSMICAESLCCGTPIVGFYAGGPESISIPEYSRFVEYGNIESLNNAIHELITCKCEKESISKKAINTYSSSSMADKYLGVYTELLSKVL